MNSQEMPTRDDTPTDHQGDDGDLPYDELKTRISELSSGDTITTNVFVDTATVVDTSHDAVPYMKSIKKVEAEVAVEGPNGNLYDITAGSFSKHEQGVDAHPRHDTGRKPVTHLAAVSPPTDAEDQRWPPIIERATGATPPDSSLTAQDDWQISTICYRFLSGPNAETTVSCAATDTTVQLGDEHLYVRARRETAPTRRHGGYEYTSWVIATPDALEAWFSGDTD